MSKITLSGFGDSNVNGEYYFSHTINDKPLYVKDSNTYMVYATSLMPYTNCEGYYVIRKFQVQGAIPLHKVRYWTSETNAASIASATWMSTIITDSLQDTTGTTGSAVYEDISSSSSSTSSESVGNVSSSSTSSSSQSSSSSYSSSSSSSSSA